MRRLRVRVGGCVSLRGFQDAQHGRRATEKLQSAAIGRTVLVMAGAEAKKVAEFVVGIPRGNPVSQKNCRPNPTMSLLAAQCGRPVLYHGLSSAIRKRVKMMLVDWRNGFFERFKHLRPSQRMMYPVGGGFLGLLVCFGCWYALLLAASLLVLTDQNVLTTLQASEPTRIFSEFARTTGLEHRFTTLATFTGINTPYLIAAAAAALWACAMMIVMLFGQWMTTSTGAALAAIWRAWNGHAQSTRADIRTILGAGSLLTAWMAVFGIQIWPFIVWDVVLAGGIGAALWRLRHPAERERFDLEARAELRRAAEAAGLLGMVCFAIFVMMAGNSHSAIAAMAAPWPTLLAIVGAGAVLGFSLSVERHLRNALIIARREPKG